DRKSTRLNSSHVEISYAVFCLKKKKNRQEQVSPAVHGSRVRDPLGHAARLFRPGRTRQATVFACPVGARRNFFFFFFNDTATTEIYTLSLHDALPIYQKLNFRMNDIGAKANELLGKLNGFEKSRSEEHTSELQSRRDLVCRLLLE